MNINLHPWRQEQREEKKKEFFSVIALTGMLFFLIAIFINQVMVSKISEQNYRNKYLVDQKEIYQKDIDTINELKKYKENIVKRMFVINSLQSDRPKVVKLFDEVISTLPKELHLKYLDRTGSIITFEGVSYSNNNTSTFIKNLQESKIFSNPRLDKITAIEDTDIIGHNKFLIKVDEKFHRIKVEEKE